MSTLASEIPDTLDLDYFYKKCSDTFGVAFYEEDPKNITPIPSKSKPITCLTKTLRSNTKSMHFLFAPKTSAITQCLCGIYHTNFISADNTEYNTSIPNFTILLANSSNKKTKAFLQNLEGITENIPPSPTPTLCQYTCPKCWLLIKCKLSNNNH